jgi:hypothetical protein
MRCAPWLLALALCGGLPLPVGAAGPTPRVIVDQPTLDLGRVVRGQTVEGTFVVRNLGAGTLHLLEVKPTCSCTVASYDEAIAPGQVGRITAKLSTKDMRGPVDRGLNVTTDDPDQPQVPLWIHADVVGSVQLLPRPNLLLRPTSVVPSPVARLLVRQDPNEKGEMRLSDARTDLSWLRVTARRVGAPEPAQGDFPEALAGDVVVEVALAGEAPEGTEKTTLRFATGLPTEPQVEVPVVVYVQPRLTVTPDEVRFGPPDPDGQRRALLLVSVRDDLGEAPPVLAGPDGLKVQLDPAGAHRYQVRLTWPADVPPRGALTVRAGEVSRSLPLVADPAPR